jgi:hypothetical protein
VPLNLIVNRWSLKRLAVGVYTSIMSMNLPLKDMTLQEKLAAMELLWEDLARSPESVESPDWHKDILDERHKRAAEGKANFVDWETAKKDIRNKIS